MSVNIIICKQRNYYFVSTIVIILPYPLLSFSTEIIILLALLNQEIETKQNPSPPILYLVKCFWNDSFFLVSDYCVKKQIIILKRKSDIEEDPDAHWDWITRSIKDASKR